MSEEKNFPVPTEINLHSKSRLLIIGFSDGQKFEYPCEYLRVYSKAAERKALDKPETGKENVNITEIEPQGTYAVRLKFDDGHDTGIYSWQTLYKLGAEKEQLWQDYLNRLEEIGYQRNGDNQREKSMGKITLMYFAYIAKYLRRESETLDLPPSVNTVEDVLSWLSKIKHENGYLMNKENVTVTINKQFAEMFTRVEAGDEIGIVPVSPTPPPRP